ncbi:hypothetical protein ABZX75_29495 [Streptomyces sp. NPDC003038]|uniref:hypothetical protein n=1 Tax=unclassified Streptomyces TaxID=2593676 RepID=UPI0033B0A786
MSESGQEHGEHETPLERVTGEKDVHPEEERASADVSEAEGAEEEDSTPTDSGS